MDPFSGIARRASYGATKSYCNGQIISTINKRLPELVKKIEAVRAKRDQLRRQRSKQTRKIAFIEGTEYDKGKWYAPDDPSLELKGHIEYEDGHRYYLTGYEAEREAFRILDPAIDAVEREYEVLENDFNMIGDRADYLNKTVKRFGWK